MPVAVLHFLGHDTVGGGALRCGVVRARLQARSCTRGLRHEDKRLIALKVLPLTHTQGGCDLPRLLFADETGLGDRLGDPEAE